MFSSLYISDNLIPDGFLNFCLCLQSHLLGFASVGEELSIFILKSKFVVIIHFRSSFVALETTILYEKKKKKKKN